MRKFPRKMSMALAALALATSSAWADTSVIQHGVGGWTKITSIPADPSPYYFVFVDHSQDLMLSFGEGHNQSTNAAYKTMVYRTSEDPAMNPAMLWTLLDANDGGYSIKSATESTYFLQTEENAAWYCRTHDNGGNNASWYKWILAYADGSWTIQNGKYPGSGYIGGWDVSPKNGLNVAANNTAIEKIGHFQIYAILKADVNWIGNASSSKPANLTYKIANSYAAFNGTTGWTGSGAQTRNSNVGFDGVSGFFEFCNWNATSWSGSLSQTISGLPAGKYEVRAAGQLSATDVTMTLDVNGSSAEFPANDTSNGTILSSGEETTAGSGVAGWRYVTVPKNLSSNENLTITFSSSATAQYRWANFDNVELYYLGPITSTDLTAGDECTDLFITNPGFEANGEVVNLSAGNLTDVTGWTLASANNTNDVGTREYSNGTFATINGVGSYCFNSYWEGKPLVQEIGPLPAGTYEVSALVTTGNGSSTGTVYLNAGDVHSTGYARKSANTNFFHREKLVFTLSSDQTVTIGIRGGNDVDGSATKGTWNENGYWWYKCDDFRLVYIGDGTQSSLYSKLQTLLANCEPWTSGDEYATRYATYSTYTVSNTVAELTTAVDYLNNEYEKYALAYGSCAHPYDMQVIENPSYNNGQTGWETTLNQTGGGAYSITSDGTQANFFQSTYNTHMRHATVYQNGINLDEGIYKLSARMKGTPKDDESTYIYATTGSVNHWSEPVFAGTTYYGYLTTDVASAWSTVDAYITLTAPATVRIGALSWGNNYSGGNGGAFSVDDWKLEKIDYAVSTKAGVVTAVGAAPLSEINASLTSDVCVLDLKQATGISSAAISTTNNANLLIFANSGQVSNTRNVVVGTTCANFVLADGHPFLNPTAFTATSARYTVSALAGGSYATLMIPFTATSLAGTAYQLDQDINLVDGSLRGTAVASIEANKPVLVTATGDYTGSSVSVPAVAKGATYTNGKLEGVYQDTSAPTGSYVLQNHTSGEGVAFYLVGSVHPTVGPFRAYIQEQSNNAKAIRVLFEDETSGIMAVDETNDFDTEGATFYTVGGTRLSAPARGVNIVKTKDGKIGKMIVK